MNHAIAAQPSRPQVGRLAERRQWVRDLAVIGALSGALAPAAVGLPMLGFIAIAGVIGGLSGAATGALAANLLGRERVRRTPVLLLLAGGFGLGALWGGLTGLGAALGLGAVHGPSALLVVLSTMLAAVAGAIQLGWFWLPYAVLRARGRRTWPLVVVASILAPGLGWAALMTVAAAGAFGP